jgi:glucosamine kinase
LPRPYLAGIDGGGTRTTLVLATADGEELARRAGPPTLVDPRNPLQSAELVIRLLAEGRAEAGLDVRPLSLCAGLAGVGNPVERHQVEEALAGVADHVRVVSDGEIALQGAFGDGAGILVIAGTGSVAYGRAEDGRIDRCGGWGLVLGDEGSGYAIGRAGLSAALRAVDGREPETALLARFLEVLGLDGPRSVPPWAGRAEKARIAALAQHVFAIAGDGDMVAERIVSEQAMQLADHVTALARRLGPWSGEVPVVFHGGALGAPFYAAAVRERLDAAPLSRYAVRPAHADAISGALSIACAMVYEHAAGAPG